MPFQPGTVSVVEIVIFVVIINIHPHKYSCPNFEVNDITLIFLCCLSRLPFEPVSYKKDNIFIGWVWVDMCRSIWLCWLRLSIYIEYHIWYVWKRKSLRFTCAIYIVTRVRVQRMLHFRWPTKWLLYSVQRQYYHIFSVVYKSLCVYVAWIDETKINI